ncbi:MAG TPA: HAD family phosphatase [Candidatus Saccharimonadales bacterium]|nr:HAD family phosphatase [Candidatus Saccharimonadales bacterium]
MGRAERQGANAGGRIRAVVLDYGEVLCRRPKAQIFARMAKLFRMQPAEYFEAYIASRGPYDQGVVGPEEYWRGFAGRSGVSADEATIAQLREWDTEMWGDVSEEMTDWVARLDEAGMKTALLSNMQHDMAAYARKNFAWLRHIDEQVLSCEVGLIKPDPAIFHLTAERIGVQSEEVLLVDDREANVASAKGTGMAGIRFQNVGQLREELEDMGFEVLPNIAAGGFS